LLRCITQLHLLREYALVLVVKQGRHGKDTQDLAYEVWIVADMVVLNRIPQGHKGIPLKLVTQSELIVVHIAFDNDVKHMTDRIQPYAWGG